MKSLTSADRLSRTISRRTIVKGAGALALGTLMSPNVVRASSGKIKIGYIGCLSGLRAEFSVADLWTINQMKALVAKGLDVGGKTYEVEFVIRDNQSDVNRSASVASELVLRERCNLVLVADGDGALAIGELADTRRVPVISTMMPWEGLYAARGSTPEKGFPYTFHFFPSSASILQNYVGMWNAAGTNGRVGTIYLDHAVGRALMDPAHGLPAQMKQAGMTEVAAGAFQLGTTDFSNQIARFKDGNCDVLAGYMFQQHFVTFWNQVRQAGLTPKVCTFAAAFAFSSTMEALGKSGDGMTTDVFWTPSYPYKSSLTGIGARDLANQWQNESGKQWLQPLGYIHALWEVGFAALKQSTDPRDANAVRTSIANLDIETMAGRVNFKTTTKKSIADMPMAAGQWRFDAAAKFPFDLDIVYNALAPEIPVTANLRLLQNA
ncbi:ABC transporter substrate-binding protein [Agrobacterium vitis]|uniref:ABC transporter substrate-binding protein n=1 Tax=Allorhizobium ampelinum TaxID=3025782 RepID=UPI001F351C55|nr:ABC transporter substrate-binding protein [Allorhizobium ampelinum]MCF1462091.1 ABC transporter substrate-binding protein [Allorhizobium ampelinum]